MNKIAGLTIVSLPLAGMAGIGTWAFFSDTGTSTGNMTAGTPDLKTNNADGVIGTLMATNMAPVDTVGPQSITLENTGSTNGSTLDLALSYERITAAPIRSI